MSLMVIGMAFTAMPSAVADITCPIAALACVPVSGAGTLVIPGGCTLGTTKVVHAHPPAGAVTSISSSCAFGAAVTFAAASCTSNQECTVISSNSIGGDLHCTIAGGDGYCAVFP